MKRSIVVNLDPEGKGPNAIKALGREMWRLMQTRAPTVDRRSTPEVMRDLRRWYGDAPAIARALGETPGTAGYRAALRTIQRQLKGERGIGKAYVARYRAIAPPSSESRLWGGAPRQGRLGFMFEGTVFIPSKGRRGDDERERTIFAPQDRAWTDPDEWPRKLADPLEAFYEDWGGPLGFTGDGRFTITFLDY